VKEKRTFDSSIFFSVILKLYFKCGAYPPSVNLNLFFNSTVTFSPNTNGEDGTNDNIIPFSSSFIVP
jgi:hypothetical protein